MREHTPHQHPAASGQQVVDHFLDMHDLSGNWGTSVDNDKWWVTGTCTYINGIMLTIDEDYSMAYLLEVCDQREDATWVTHMAVYTHMSEVGWEWHYHRPHRFFECHEFITKYDLYEWVVNWHECLCELRRNSK